MSFDIGDKIPMSYPFLCHPFQADWTILETPEVISPYTPVAKPCGFVGNSTGGSAPVPKTDGASSITSLGVFSLLLIALIWNVC